MTIRTSQKHVYGEARKKSPLAWAELPYVCVHEEIYWEAMYLSNKSLSFRSHKYYYVDEPRHSCLMFTNCDPRRNIKLTASVLSKISKYRRSIITNRIF